MRSGAERVVVELDGHESHAKPAAVERDRRRDLELRAAGFEVRRYTWQQVTRAPDAVVADLRTAIDRRGPDQAADP
jgi:very-short-patch-repair endonuclease